MKPSPVTVFAVFTLGFMTALTTVVATQTLTLSALGELFEDEFTTGGNLR